MTLGKVALPRADGGSLQLTGVLVMGILNATPDSFSDGGQIDDPMIRGYRIDAMLAAGVDIIDIGGESTRPGHTTVAADEEIRRTIPVIEDVRNRDAGIPISIDTRKAVVAGRALEHGVSFVNDVSGLADPGMGQVVAAARCAYIAMRSADCDGPILDCCRQQLADLTVRALSQGILDEGIVVDPGLGFGTRPGGSRDDNLALIDGISHYSLGRPVLVGASRKRFVQRLATELGKTVADQSVALAVRAAQAGAAIVRVHDVPETITALKYSGLRQAG